MRRAGLNYRLTEGILTRVPIQPPIPPQPIIPPGFDRHFRQSPVTDPWEPLYSKRDGEAFVLGFIVAAAHCNSRGMLHGGVISALADNAMGLACAFALGGDARLLTAHLSVDFTGIAQLGSWVEVIARPTRTGRTMCFAAARVITGDELVAQATAVFRASPPPKT